MSELPAFLRLLFGYEEGLPLTFTQLFFWGFFVVVLAGFAVVHKRIAVRNAWLFVASLFFYYKTSGLFVLILLFSTVSDFTIAHLIHRATSLSHKRLWLALSVSINLLLLGYFKYAHFLVENINRAFGTHYVEINWFAQWGNGLFGTSHVVDRILLPVGISFFTFQAISYAVDVYRDEIKPVRGILDFGFFVSFFPQLVAGPIVRAAAFIPQVLAPYQLSRRDFGLAVFWILNGLVKKVVIGDHIALNFIDRVFNDPMRYSGFECMMALFAYSLQVYADFSGYTDIAIGVALLMGFKLATNFNSPYKAVHVGEFWKRWHMSLSTWLRDYLYIPLGGNRGASLGTWICLGLLVGVAVLLSGAFWLVPLALAVVALGVLLARWIPGFNNWTTTNANLMITMLLGGLWHGASWMFVIWGGLNGLALVFYNAHLHHLHAHLVPQPDAGGGEQHPAPDRIRIHAVGDPRRADRFQERVRTDARGLRDPLVADQLQTKLPGTLRRSALVGDGTCLYRRGVHDVPVRGGGERAVHLFPVLSAGPPVAQPRPPVALQRSPLFAGCACFAFTTTVQHQHPNNTGLRARETPPPVAARKPPGAKATKERRNAPPTEPSPHQGCPGHRTGAHPSSREPGAP